MNEQQQFWKEKYAASYRDKNDNFNEEKGIEAWKLMLSKSEVPFNFQDHDSKLIRCREPFLPSQKFCSERQLQESLA